MAGKDRYNAKRAGALMPALLLVLLAAFPAAAQDWNCEDADNLPQQGMNYCAGLEFQKADAELNALWPQLVAQAEENDALDVDDGRPGYRETLVSAQRAWIAFRDANCAYSGYQAKGGSLEPLLVAACLTHMTEQRIGELKTLMQEFGMQ